MQRLNTNPKRGHVRQTALSSRIAALMKFFSDGRPHKAAELAQQIGVNSRTIRRTLHLMRDEMGIPLIANREGFQVQQSNASEPVNVPASTSSAETSTQFWTRAITPQHT